MTTIFLAKTSAEKEQMKDGLLDRFAYKVFFPQVNLNTFHKTTQHVVNMILSQNYIDLKTNKWIYIDSQVADRAVHKLPDILFDRLRQNKYDNRKILQTLKLALHNSKNFNKKSEYKIMSQSNINTDQTKIQNDETNSSNSLWYLR